MLNNAFDCSLWQSLDRQTQTQSGPHRVRSTHTLTHTQTDTHTHTRTNTHTHTHGHTQSNSHTRAGKRGGENRQEMYDS